MNIFKQRRKRLKEIRAVLLDVYNQAIKKINEESIKYITCFGLVYMLISDFLVLSKKLELRKSKNPKEELEKLENLWTDIKKNTKILIEFGKAVSKIKLEALMYIFEKKKGGFETMFSTKHKKTILKWEKKKPTKEEIIRTLEFWTGVKGEEAVEKMINILSNDSRIIYNNLLELHGLNNKFNMSINSLMFKLIMDLTRYYLKHKKKYLAENDEVKTILIDDGVKIGIRDKYLNISLKFKNCDFEQCVKTIKTIMKSIDIIDKKILKKLLKQNFDLNIFEMEVDVFARKNVKNKILENLNKINDEFECYELKINAEIPSGDSKIAGNFGIVENVKKFVQLEELVEKKFQESRENFELQMQNFTDLVNYVEILTGPSVETCIKRLAPFIKTHIGDENFEKKIGDYV